MAKFVTSVVVHLYIEAEDVHQASRKLHVWRRFIVAALRGRLAEAGIYGLRIPASLSQPFKGLTEVDEAWLENDKLRSKFQQEWEYETHEVPIVPGSKLCLTHRVALGPRKQSPEQGTA